MAIHIADMEVTELLSRYSARTGMSKTESLRRLLRNAVSGTDIDTHEPYSALICKEVLEKHFTCRELAEMWGWSESKVYKMFVAQDGILKSGIRSKRRRTKISFRIPLSVAERVYREHSV